MYAISSAGLVHEFARACAQGTLDRCTCDESKHLENTKTWLWGGCGDNIRFGLKFTRKFLRRSRRAEKDIRAQVDDHNSGAGIKVVRDLVKTTCKCHGVSGSCTVRTCWLQLSPFQSVGSVLKARYERSAKVISFPNQATGNVQLMKRLKPGGQRNHLARGRKKRPQIQHLMSDKTGKDKTRHHESYYYFNKRGKRKHRRRNRQKWKRRLHLKRAPLTSLSSSSSAMSSSSLSSSDSLSSSYSFPDPSSQFPASYLDASTANLYSRHSATKSEHANGDTNPAELDKTSRENVQGIDSAMTDDPGAKRRLGRIVPLRRSDLTYIEDSPSYCRQGRYSPGTSGRSCIKGDNCDSICCGRGYNVQKRTVVKACKCEVIWCCKVKCQECPEEEEIYLCK
ncbi:protein wnt [Plakobranchus ocellatus]|uniref:Protein Wnt n=1 Tax=Plakobranchus ocellatus TaxID=259542 RepID=A0AAV3YIN9_9GAST|nr:protein wnt [Plakobranchus ocellatus]